MAHRKGQRGDGLDARVHVDVDAIGGKHASGDLLEVLALVARVAREGERGVLVVGVQVVGDALGGLCDHVDVHAVGADAERAAQACRAEGEVAIEGVEELVLVAVLDELGELGREVGIGDVVLPGLDRGLDASVHSVFPHFRSGRGRTRALPTRVGRFYSRGRVRCGGSTRAGDDGRRMASPASRPRVRNGQIEARCDCSLISSVFGHPPAKYTIN